MKKRHAGLKFGSLSMLRIFEVSQLLVVYQLFEAVIFPAKIRSFALSPILFRNFNLVNDYLHFSSLYEHSIILYQKFKLVSQSYIITYC